MPVFHPKAYQAALNISGRKLALPPNRDFDDWNKIFSALDLLTPQERCDTLYADWVMQLSSPGGDAQLQIRSLLLERGALAANYLAELAQNADDAADGEEAKLVIRYEEPWLVVANNGRRITSRNLLGLCRFFVHWGRDPDDRIEELNEATIGKFGIGFKSCYNVADEVLVASWDTEDEFGFRLPIPSKSAKHSLPEQTRLERIKVALEQFDCVVSRDIEELGYCTPEFIEAEKANRLRNGLGIDSWKRGTVFRFRLHTNGQARLKERLDVGTDGLYELCPLFLPNLKEINFCGHSLKLSDTRARKTDSAELPLKAQRVTLATNSGEKIGRDRFWRLVGTGKNSCWSVALAADADFKIRSEQSSVESLHLRGGGAYAFFPLNNVNAYWTPRIHLHVDIATNLARSDWNDDEAEEVREQIMEAAETLADWLCRRVSIWHSDFKVEDLFPSVPRKSERWAYAFFDYFRQSIEELPVFKCFGGKMLKGKDAKALKLHKNTSVQSAARALEDSFSGRSLTTKCVIVWDDVEWGLANASMPETKDFFYELLEAEDRQPELDLNIAYLLFASEDISTDAFENVCKRVIVPRGQRGSITLSELLGGVGGEALDPKWHELFRFVEANAPPQILSRSIFGKQTRGRLNELKISCDVFDWESLHETLNCEEAWRNRGEKFWKNDCAPCPERLKEQVVQAIHTKDRNGRWEPITSKWLLDANPSQCFLGQVTMWKFQVNGSERENIVTRLKRWDLWDAYEGAMTKRLRTLHRKLTNSLNADFSKTLERLDEKPIFNSLNSLLRNQPAVAALVREQIKTGIEEFLEPSLTATSDRVYSQNGFTAKEESILLWLGYKIVSNRLDARALAVYKKHGVELRERPVITAPVSATNRSKLAIEVLDKAWVLEEEAAPNADAFESIAEWFSDATGNWQISTSRNRRDHLRDVLAIRVKGDPFDLLEHTGGQVDLRMNRRLPPQLGGIEALRRVALTFGDCKATLAHESDSEPILATQVPEDIRSSVQVKIYFNTHPDLDIRYISPLDVDFVRQEQVVCTVRNASYFVRDDTLYVGRAIIGNDSDYSDKLAVYLSLNPDPQIEQLRQQGEASRSIYRQYRDKIIRVFRKELVDDVGYKKAHILRELLQNAESAYAGASEQNSSIKPFSVKTEQANSGNLHRVSVTHYGRQFNEPDRNGTERNDIDRIVSIGNPIRRDTEDEIGRFNRGFKSLFHVTEHVGIKSGAYEFGIRDLLLLEPSRPEASDEPCKFTTFTFECSTRDLGLVVGKRDQLTIFTPETFIFTRQLTDVEISTDQAERKWAISRHAIEDGWLTVQLNDSATGESRFHVKHFKAAFSNRSVDYAVAYRVDTHNRPEQINRKANRLALTFPTEDPGFGNILLSGDFSVNPGRLGVLMDGVLSSILTQSLDHLLDECRSVLEEGGITDWLAWLRFISPLQLEQEIKQRLTDHALPPLKVLKRIREEFLDRVPHDGGFCNASELTFPSKVLRQFASNAQSEIDFTINISWAGEEVHETLREHLGNAAIEETTLGGWTEKHLDEETFKQVRHCIEALIHNASAAVVTEVRAALNQFQPPSDLPTIAGNATILDLEELAEWWAQNFDQKPYIATGVWWKYVVTEKVEDTMGDDKNINSRDDYFRSCLLDPSSDVGKQIWFRFVSIAALLSAGRKTSELLSFMEANGPFQEIWNATTETKLNQGLDTAFDQLIETQKDSEYSRGEYAYIWRRVFYDLRKIFRIVHKYGFAESILELCEHDASAVDIARFMKGGFVNGDPQPWVGVLGQTASSTLLFLLRELRRIGLLSETHTAHCYFMCRPVRRTAFHLGLLEEGDINETDLFRLMDLSKELHEAIHENPAIRDKLKGTYDIPFLAYGLNVL